MYSNRTQLVYVSPRYGRSLTVPKGYKSDGATGALDIWSRAWWVHDMACETGQWDDGHPMSNWDASTVLSDILLEEGRWARAVYWWWFTYLFGGGKARQNGMFQAKRWGAGIQQPSPES